MKPSKAALTFGTAVRVVKPGILQGKLFRRRGYCEVRDLDLDGTGMRQGSCRLSCHAAIGIVAGIACFRSGSNTPRLQDSNCG